MKIFVDANVLFSAAYMPDGKSAVLLEGAAKLIVTSDYGATEAKRNILAKKPAALGHLDRILSKIKIIPSAGSGPCPIDLPAKDQPIFLAAIKVSATHLITGDKKHFGPHMNQPQKTFGILIQTVAEFLKAL